MSSLSKPTYDSSSDSDVRSFKSFPDVSATVSSQSSSSPSPPSASKPVRPPKSPGRAQQSPPREERNPGGNHKLKWDVKVIPPSVSSDVNSSPEPSPTQLPPPASSSSARYAHGGYGQATVEPLKGVKGVVDWQEPDDEDWNSYRVLNSMPLNITAKSITARVLICVNALSFTFEENDDWREYMRHLRYRAVLPLVVSIYPQWDDEFKATSEDIFQLPMFASQFFTSMEDIHTMSANVPTIWAMIQNLFSSKSAAVISNSKIAAAIFTIPSPREDDSAGVIVFHPQAYSMRGTATPHAQIHYHPTIETASEAIYEMFGSQEPLTTYIVARKPPPQSQAEAVLSAYESNLRLLNLQMKVRDLASDAITDKRTIGTTERNINAEETKTQNSYASTAKLMEQIEELQWQLEQMQEFTNKLVQEQADSGLYYPKIWADWADGGSQKGKEKSWVTKPTAAIGGAVSSLLRSSSRIIPSRSKSGTSRDAEKQAPKRPLNITMDKELPRAPPHRSSTSTSSRMSPTAERTPIDRTPTVEHNPFAGYSPALERSPIGRSPVAERASVVERTPTEERTPVPPERLPSYSTGGYDSPHRRRSPSPPRRRSPSPVEWMDERDDYMDPGLQEALRLQAQLQEEEDMSYMLAKQIEEEEKAAAAAFEQLQKTEAAFQPFDCPICADTLPPEDLIVVETCRHELCRACVLNHVKAQITQNSWPIFCPMCPNTVKRRGVISRWTAEIVGADDSIFDRWNRMEVAGFAIDVECPRCKKTAPIDAEDFRGTKVLICPRGCGAHWCKDCHRELERNGIHSCDGEEEFKAMVNSQKALFKRCPRCGTMIEKNGGCDHMHCHAPGCGHDFAWSSQGR